MSTAEMASPTGQQSEISCHTCRRRKVKCDRNYPHCQVCEQTMQTCTYPPGPLKPGPKIGSLRQRKRSRATIDDGPEPATAASYRERNESPSFPADATDDSILLVTAGGQNASSTAEAKALDLSFILHPAHAASPPNNDDLGPRKDSSGDTHTRGAVQQACSTLGVEMKEAEQLLTAYFDNMVAINLFHEPTFSDKLSRITSPALVVALLAAMFTFAVRLRPGEADINQRAMRFLKLALQHIEKALDECGDNTPPLCLLQASIIAAHCQLTQGVLGRAWRALGMCVRLAYEMNLHLVDVQSHGDIGGSVDVEKWCEDEEKRRAWWAIWEMDVFATTIRRTPTALDWSQIEILLPVDDDAWFQRKPQPSCFFEQDPMRRWKALDSCNNQSPKAWFIVINSLMKEAQRISSPRGIPSRSRSDHIDDAHHRLEVIANAVRCFQLALPGHLKYNHQHLTFDARVPGQATSSRQMHSSIYNIHIMTQLARLMIYRYDVFRGRFRVALPTHDSQRNSGDGSKEDDQSSVKEYFDAADSILAIINRSSDDHVRHINPFLSSTIWLASAVQLMRSQLCRPGALKSAMKSRYEVLNLTYKKCSRFWDMHTAVQQNLETLEEQLEACKQGSQTPAPSGNPNSSRRHEWRVSPGVAASNGQNAVTGNRPNPATAFTPTQQANSTEAAAFPSPPQSHIMAQDDLQVDKAGDANSASMLDFMPLQGMDSQPMPSQFISATLVDPMFLFGTNSPSLDFNRLWEMEPFEYETPQLDTDYMPAV